VKGVAKVYKGAFVGLSGGYARPLIAGDPFAGIAYEEADNTSGSDGAVFVRVFTLGDFELPLVGAARTNNRSALFASDDQTLTGTASGNSFVGNQIDVPATNRVLLRIQVTPTPLAGGTLSGELVSAGIKHKLTTKASAANVTITTADLGGIIQVTGTTAGNLNLPAAATAGAGAWCTFMKSGASGALTIDPNASETIDGAATNAEMDAANDSITIVCDGTSWIITAKKIS
jgi:hypothetical protein